MGSAQNVENEGEKMPNKDGKGPRKGSPMYGKRKGCGKKRK